MCRYFRKFGVFFLGAFLAFCFLTVSVWAEDEVVAENEIVSESETAGTVLYLELMWLTDSGAREALLMVPDEKVPLVLLRVLDKEENLQALVVAQGELSVEKENSENEKDGEVREETSVILVCSGTKLLWGKLGMETEMPDLAVFQEARGAVDVKGKLSPCLVLAVGAEREKEVLDKYVAPETEGNETEKETEKE